MPAPNKLRVVRQYTEDPHIQAIIAAGHLKLVPSSVSGAFHEYLMDAYPWVPVTQNSIDWTLVPNVVRLEILEASDEDVLMFVKQTLVGQYRLAAVFFAPHEPLLVGELSYVARSLDTLYWGASGTRFVFGVQATADGYVCARFRPLHRAR